MQGTRSCAQSGWVVASVTRTEGHISNTACDALFGLMACAVLVELSAVATSLPGSLEAPIHPWCCPTPACLPLFGLDRQTCPNTFPLSQAACQGRASLQLPPRKRRFWKLRGAGLRGAGLQGIPYCLLLPGCGASVWHV